MKKLRSGEMIWLHKQSPWGPWPMLIQPTICGSRDSRQPKPYSSLKGTAVPYSQWHFRKYLLILITTFSKGYIFHSKCDFIGEHHSCWSLSHNSNYSNTLYMCPLKNVVSFICPSFQFFPSKFTNKTESWLCACPIWIIVQFCDYIF